MPEAKLGHPLTGSLDGFKTVLWKCQPVAPCRGWNHRMATQCFLRFIDEISGLEFQTASGKRTLARDGGNHGKKKRPGFVSEWLVQAR